MCVLVRSRCATVALTTAIAIAATTVHPAPQTLGQQRTDATYSSVGVPLLTLASFETVLAASDSTSAQLEPARGAWPAAATTAAATATTTSAGDVLYDVARDVAFWAGVALLPLWWIAFPVTFPIGYFVGQQVLFPVPPNYVDFMGLRALGLMFSAVALPPLLAVNLFPARAASTDAATPTASTQRSSAASATEIVGTNKPVTDGTAIHYADGNLEGIKSTAPKPKRPAKPAAAVVRSPGSPEQRGAEHSARKGKSAPSDRIAETEQREDRSAATPHDGKIPAMAASRTATGPAGPNPTR